jgi:lipopolysaccharide export system permease protein
MAIVYCHDLGLARSQFRRGAQSARVPPGASPGKQLSKFDRYMLSQLMVVFGFFSLVMVLVYWINRAVLIFDQLISDGQTASVFLEFTMLTLPNVIRLVLPMSAFAATVYVTNRLSSESELTVMQATGFGPFRLARPILVFGVLVALMVSVLVHFVVPSALATLAEREAEISADMTARFLRDGQFHHPADGITFYVKEISPSGEMVDALLIDSTEPDEQAIYTAHRAYLVNVEGEPYLRMFDGIVQILDNADQSLSVTRFQEATYAIADTMGRDEGEERRLGELSTLELIRPTPQLLDEVDHGRARLLVEGHERFSQATLTIVAPLLGFSILLLGRYSRFGIWRQVLSSVLVVIVAKMVDTAFVDVALTDERLWPLVYLGSAVGVAAICLTLWYSARERRAPPVGEMPA